MRISTLAWTQRLCLFAALFLAPAGSTAAAVDPATLPKPTGYVSDLANVVSSDDKAKLEALCTRVDSELGVQFALVTIDTVGDADIRDFALKVFRAWGVGDKKTNQGVLLLLAIKDHKSDIETGRGIEPYLTDGFSGGTLRSMRPDLRTSNYGSALLSAVHEMARQVAQGKNIAFADENATQTVPDLGPRDVEPSGPPRSGRRGGSGFPFWIIGVFVVLWLLGRGGRRGGGMGGGGSFLTGMLLGNLLGGGGRSGGSWGSGGGFGGGDSGGGGGFGGFGGGDAGGGGASSDW